MFSSSDPTIRIVLKIQDWLLTLTEEEKDSIMVVYVTLPDFIRNIGFTTSTAIVEVLQRPTSTVEDMIEWFFDEELEHCYNVLDAAINDGALNSILEDTDDYTPVMDKCAKNIRSALESFKEFHLSLFSKELSEFLRRYNKENSLFDCSIEDINNTTIALLITIRG